MFFFFFTAKLSGGLQFGLWLLLCWQSSAVKHGDWFNIMLHNSVLSICLQIKSIFGGFVHLIKTKHSSGMKNRSATGRFCGLPCHLYVQSGPGLPVYSRTLQEVCRRSQRCVLKLVSCKTVVWTFHSRVTGQLLWNVMMSSWISNIQWRNECLSWGI